MTIAMMSCSSKMEMISSPTWRWCNAVVGNNFKPMMVLEKLSAMPIKSASCQLKLKAMATGTVTAKKCLIATNAYGGDLEPVGAQHIMPIRSFIGATPPP